MKLFIKGWAFLEGTSSDGQEVYLQITDKTGKIYTYETSQYIRTDVAAAFNDERYNYSGFSMKTKEDMEDVKINIIIKNNGYFMSTETNYTDARDSNKMVEDDTFSNKEIENFTNIAIIKKVKFHIDMFVKTDETMKLQRHNDKFFNPSVLVQEYWTRETLSQCIGKKIKNFRNRSICMA